MRRVFELTGNAPDRLPWRFHHDEGVEVFLNGIGGSPARGFLDRIRLPRNQCQGRPIGSQRNCRGIAIRHPAAQYIDVGIDAIVPGDAPQK